MQKLLAAGGGSSPAGRWQLFYCGLSRCCIIIRYSNAASMRTKASPAKERQTSTNKSVFMSVSLFSSAGESTASKRATGRCPFPGVR